MNTHYDIIITGGGVIGTSLAINLGQKKLQKNFKILLIDDKPASKPKQLTQAVVAINRASESFFKQLDIWSTINTACRNPYQRIEVWEETTPGQLTFDALDVNEANLGHIVHVDALQTALTEKLKHMDNVSILHDTQLTGLIKKNEMIEATLSNGAVYNAQLLIGADGKHSSVRQLAGFTQQARSYDHDAIVTTVTCEKPHQQTARQRFLKQGPLAFLPLADSKQCSIVWSVTPQQADELMTLNSQAFCQRLGTAFDCRLDRITHVTQRLRFPLKEHSVETLVQPHIALIGDAAHTLHPLAGQGMNLGLADIACLTDILTHLKDNERQFGRIEYLKRYQQQRHAQHKIFIKAMAGFKTLFTQQQESMRLGRSAGYWLMGKLPMLKKPIIQMALGLNYTPPSDISHQTR